MENNSDNEMQRGQTPLKNEGGFTMTTKERYESAKEIYGKIGVDTDKVLETLKSVPISMHCWQGDDVGGFDSEGALTGGIQATGNYPGKARTPEELMADIDKALSLIPGTHRINAVSYTHLDVYKRQGKKVECRVEKGYVYLENGIRAGDEIHLLFIMAEGLIQANPKVRADAGKAAIQRGPVVYCLEEEDNGSNLSAIRLETDCGLQIAGTVLPGGIPAITAKGYRTEEDGWAAELYRPYIRQENEVTVKAVPYFLWGNREPGEMLVWVRV